MTGQNGQVGRPPKDEEDRRKKRTFWASDREWKRITKLAKKSGLPVGVWTRRCALGGGGERELLRRIEAHVSVLGGHLRAIAEQLDEGGTITPEAMEHAARQIAALLALSREEKLAY